MKSDLTGMKFGRWTVLGYSHTNGLRALYWTCKCECGTIKEVSGNSLRNNRSKSCGCLSKEVSREVGKKSNKSHGQFGTPLYFVWNSMKQRCNNPNSTSYSDYGKRGISVCDEWSEFEPFYRWAMLSGYKQGLSIDRTDNNGNYHPENCRWVSGKKQCRNRRSNKRFTYNNKNLTLVEWAEITGINRSTLASRVYTYGWNIEKALTTK